MLWGASRREAGEMAGRRTEKSRVIARPEQSVIERSNSEAGPQSPGFCVVKRLVFNPPKFNQRTFARA